MASYDGYVGPQYLGLTEDVANRAYYANASTNLGVPVRWTSHTYTLYPEPPDLLYGTPAEGTISKPVTAYYGATPRGTGEDWFEKIIIVPRSFDFGIILSVINENVELYNSYRDVSRSWNSYVNNAGAGIVITNLPGLPKVVQGQEGILLNLQIQLEGPPTIDGNLDFGFDVYTVYLPLLGQRAVVFPFVPILPLIEKLRFKTDVIEKLDGTEQRIILRDTPRQIFEAAYQLEGHARRYFESIIFDSQGRAVGLPMWHEPSVLQTAIAVDDTTVVVDSTAYADWRVDSHGIVFVDETSYEALEVESYTATTVTFKSPFTNAFPVGAYVMPVRTAYMQQNIPGTRWPRTLQGWNLVFKVFDNDTDLSDTSAFNTYNSKVLLNEPNLMGRTLAESMRRRRDEIDSETGTFEINDPWEAGRRSHGKGFFSNTRQRLWEVRQLMHALKGRAISFYLPTFFPDLEPTLALTSSSTILTIRNIGYAKHIDERQPKDVLQVVLKDGTELTRAISSSSEVDEDTETITVDSQWGQNVALDEIERVNFVEKTRLASDDVTIEHRGALGNAVVMAPTIAVRE
jgi:hypothetical protein